MSAAKKALLEVRLLFVDEGSWHRETVHIDASLLEGYERLIDGLREEPEILRRCYLDVERLSAAWVVED